MKTKGLDITITITSKAKRKANRKASRSIELELGMRTTTHKVHKNKKLYSRKQFKNKIL